MAKISNSTPWGFLGDVGSNVFTAIQNQQTRDYNLRLAKMQNQWNIDQWMRENQYNTPAAQQDRLAAGGLNPDLMYQNGAAGLMSADSPDLMSGAPADPIPFNPIDIQNRINADKLTKAEVEKKEAEAEYYRTEAEGRGIENAFKPHLLNQQVEMNGVEIELKKSYTLRNEAEAKHFNSLCDKITQEIKESEERISNMIEDRKLTQIKRDLTQKEYDFFEKNYNLKKDQIDAYKEYVNGLVDLYGKQGHLVDEQAKTQFQLRCLYGAQRILADTQAQHLDLQNDVLRLKGMDLADAEIFQRKWGSIAGAVVSFVALMVGLNVGNLFNSDNSGPGDPGYISPSDSSNPPVPWN